MGGLDVPDLVLLRASNGGAAGQRWLARLPEVVAELSARWGLELGAAFTGGTAGYVTAATDSSGRPCVLKVAMPLSSDEHDGFVRSVRAHELAAGRDAAALFAHDTSAAAMLLERLGPNLAELGMGVPEMLEAIAVTLRSFWRPVTTSDGLRTGQEQATRQARYVSETWEALDRPCERAVVDLALAFCERRAAAFDPTRAVLVHGDAHGWNTLDAGDGTYKLVDIEGLCSEAEHDLGVAMREYNEPLLAGDTARLARARAEMLADRCEADAQAVWEWGYIERVSTGLANMRDFESDSGAMFLEVARRCL